MQIIANKTQEQYYAKNCENCLQVNKDEIME